MASTFRHTASAGEPGSIAIERVKATLNKSIYVTTTDERNFKGLFKCFDSDKNILLSDAAEIYIEGTHHCHRT